MCVRIELPPWLGLPFPSPLPLVSVGRSISGAGAMLFGQGKVLGAGSGLRWNEGPVVRPSGLHTTGDDIFKYTS